MPDETLVPVVVQDAATRAVLMVAWANMEALELSLATGRMHFWSRSRGELWEKGATSGHRLLLVDLSWDCDHDTVLALVRPTGPACHTGATSCFGEPSPSRTSSLEQLDRTIGDRDRRRPEGSYVARLLGDPLLRAQKVGEEASEVVVAGLAEDRSRLVAESADLIFHLAVLLRARGIRWDEIGAELDQRRSR
ncbi:MAG: bifunctional phosphoribosyl-AMP cyclohydrolase/phosphoribosyl-ATP diphosphatase HisIE [Thermoplasmata archaeon]|jgi:phosphoribosyl-ATP pyrophosphohydrolase/phosphoribosyl-AMP cyclohydrolase